MVTHREELTRDADHVIRSPRMESKSKRAQPPEGALNFCREFPVETIGVFEDYVTFKRMASRLKPRFAIRWQDRFPCLHDKTTSTPFDRHYVYHALGRRGFGANESCSAYRYFLIAGFLRCGIGLHSGQIL